MRAFSLVELSIVLVILGLLTGGILAGQSLIRAAELRSVTTEYSRYVTATQTFRDKYMALPGDMPNATLFWGNAGGNGADATCATVIATDTKTCNGNGNGKMERLLAGHTIQNENFRFWQHLANAGLIEGQFTGRGDAGPGFASYVFTFTPGVNVPASKMSGGAWTIEARDSRTGSGGDGTGHDYGNVMFFGGGPREFYSVLRPILNESEAYNIDKKIDDGMPNTGSVLTRYEQCTTSTDKNDRTATYDFQDINPTADGSLGCVPIFARAF